jgi:hypothetical protein
MDPTNPDLDPQHGILILENICTKFNKILQKRHVLYAQVLCCNGCRAPLSWRTSAISLWTRYTRETSTRISSSPSSKTSSRSDPTSRSPHLFQRSSFPYLNWISRSCPQIWIHSFTLTERLLPHLRKIARE